MPVQTAQILNDAVDCDKQIWPQIATQCLAPVSDEGEVRNARVIF